MKFSVKFLENEHFWGGPTAFATEMPIKNGSDYSRDNRIDPRNQFMPLFLSDMGRYIWSDDTFNVWVEKNTLNFEGNGNFELWEGGKCLRDAYIAAMEAHFPFDDSRKKGKKLPRRFFSTAQYNTWMEFTYNPTQAGVLDYAHSIVDNGFEPGILIIDEGWHTRYGLWEFDMAKFPSPKEMIDELHSLGFTVMLWVTPTVTNDGQQFALLTKDYRTEDWDKNFLRNAENEPAIVEWWNGYSAILDLRREDDKIFLGEKLDRLMKEYGVDGFKFDGGSYSMYHPKNMINGTPRADHDPKALNIAWNEFGAKYEYHEYKDTFMGGGKSTIQRLCDRGHCWEGDGINTLLPCAIMQGLMGHPFICPDMIGGGEWSYTLIPGFKVDEELFIRMAQASSLFPMMQFSWAPWRVLSDESLEIIKESAFLHKKMSSEIILLIEDAEKTGEPILRSLEYNYPHNGYAEITDEFMLGENILVCPIVTKGTFTKNITFPKGRWIDDEGNIYEGGRSHIVDTPIDKLVWFRRIV
ncbi:MAG: glycoside hydrolase [Clostridia bacterium]|nr:glycoside hydrolase [Clostridia bacterium]